MILYFIIRSTLITIMINMNQYTNIYYNTDGLSRDVCVMTSDDFFLIHASFSQFYRSIYLSYLMALSQFVVNKLSENIQLILLSGGSLTYANYHKNSVPLMYVCVSLMAILISSVDKLLTNSCPNSLRIWFQYRSHWCKRVCYYIQLQVFCSILQYILNLTLALIFCY